MKILQRIAAPLLLAAFCAACSGMDTTMTKMGRVGKNRGYEIKAEIALVLQSSLAVLKAHGYETSVKADPQNGAEGAGQIAIGQKTVRYTAQPGAPAASPGQMDTRELVNVYLGKKWRISGDEAVPNVTLVEIIGTGYMKKDASKPEEEEPLSKDYLSQLRDEIERQVALDRAKPVAK